MTNKPLVLMMIRRKNKVILSRIPSPADEVIKAAHKNEYLTALDDNTRRTVIAMSAVQNLLTLGYMPDKALVDKMIADEVVSYKMGIYVENLCRRVKGADVRYTPMYLNFPEEVIETDLSELYFNQLIHYISNGRWLPQSNPKMRVPLNETVKPIILTEGTEEDVVAVMSNLVNSDIPYSVQDILDLEELVQKYDVYAVLPEFIKHRENLATLIAVMCADKEPTTRQQIIEKFEKHIVSANDVARIIYTVYDKSDATMTKKLTVKSMPRADRRLMLKLLEQCKHTAVDMKLNAKLWIRIGEILHPGEFKEKYPNTAKAFEYIRSNSLLKTIKTYNALAEKAISSGDLKELTLFANDKPGVMARNLDRILRETDRSEDVLTLWEKIAPSVAPALLWTVHAHFNRRKNDEGALRIFTTKDYNATTIVLPDETPSLSTDVCDKVIAITENALREIYKTKPAMGKIYIAPEASKIKIPNETRGQQEAGFPMTKGSRIALNPDTKFIRAFIWWTNTERGDRVDVDLSAHHLDKDLREVGQTWYRHLQGEYAVHSGDIVDGGPTDKGGVAEFIDIDIKKAKKNGVRYCVFVVHNYTEIYFEDLKNARFGYMERQEAQAGEIFEPSTVKQQIKLSASATAETICMFDLVNMEMIWIEATGQDIFRNQWLPNNVLATWQGTAMVCYKALHIEKPCTADVIRINCEARGGEIVANKDEADIVFALDEGINLLDTDYFAGELLPAEVAEKYLPIEEEPDTPTEQV